MSGSVHAERARNRKAAALRRVLYGLIGSSEIDATDAQRAIEVAKRMTPEQWAHAATCARVNPPSRETINNHLLPMLQRDLQWANEDPFARCGS